MHLPYNQAAAIPGTKSSVSYYRDACTFTFIGSLFTKAKKWCQSRCLSGDEWIKKYSTYGTYAQ